MPQARSEATSEYLRLGALPPAELETVMVRGDTPDPDALAGWEFRGRNTPGWARLAGIQKFIKGFYRDGAAQHHGYNIAVKQDGLAAPWTYARPEPRRFGFFWLGRVDPQSRDNKYLHALLIDYGRGGNPAIDPTQTLRDYLVRVERGSDELLLGTAYVAAGPLRIWTRSYFVLERYRPTDYRR